MVLWLSGWSNSAWCQKRDRLCCVCAMQKLFLFVLLLLRKCWKVVRSLVVTAAESLRKEQGRIKQNAFYSNGLFFFWSVSHFFALSYPGSSQHTPVSPPPTVQRCAVQVNRLNFLPKIIKPGFRKLSLPTCTLRTQRPQLTRSNPHSHRS